MTITENTTAGSSSAAPTAIPGGISVELHPFWGTSLRATVKRDGEDVFSCLIDERRDLATVTECLPQRRDPVVAGWLCAVCDHLLSSLSCRRIVAIHPAFWDDELRHCGARPLERITHMRTALDADLLRMHAKPLPCTHRFEPLETTSDALPVLSRLGGSPGMADESRVWGDIFAGVYGPVIPEASVRITNGADVVGATAVTEYHGEPLVAHLVTTARLRGSGFGRAALIESLTRLMNVGYADCHLNVLEVNRVARRLYRSVGFVQDRPILRASRIGPGWVQT